MPSSDTHRAAAPVLILLVALLSSGCVDLPPVTGHGGAAELRTYLLDEGDVGEGAILETDTSLNHPVGAARTWTVPPDVSPLKSLTRVENRLYGADDPSLTFRTETGGNWSSLGSLDIGDRSELLVDPSRGRSGYRVVVQERNLIAVTDVVVASDSFTVVAGDARKYVERLARRQATLLRGYPYSA